MRIRIIVNRPWFGVQPRFKPQGKFQVHAGNEAAIFSNEVILNYQSDTPFQKASLFCLFSYSLSVLIYRQVFFTSNKDIYVVYDALSVINTILGSMSISEQLHRSLP